VRTGWYRAVHIKSETSYRLRLLLTLRRNLKRKFLDIENAIRHSLKSFGIRLAGTTRGHFADVIRQIIAGDTLLLAMIEPMLEVRAAMWLQYTKLHRLVIRVVRADEVCRRFMAIPGVGPVTALQVKTALDDPRRFSRSKTVGAYFGLTSRRWQTGTSVDIQGRISKMGDDDVRRALVEAANSLLLRYQGWSALKVWGLKISKARGRKRALVAVARKLAIIMFAMWRDGTEYRFGTQKNVPEEVELSTEAGLVAA
jgi:transposase